MQHHYRLTFISHQALITLWLVFSLIIFPSSSDAQVITPVFPKEAPPTPVTTRIIFKTKNSLHLADKLKGLNGFEYKTLDYLPDARIHSPKLIVDPRNNQDAVIIYVSSSYYWQEFVEVIYLPYNSPPSQPMLVPFDYTDVNNQHNAHIQGLAADMDTHGRLILTALIQRQASSGRENFEFMQLMWGDEALIKRGFWFGGVFEKEAQLKRSSPGMVMRINEKNQKANIVVARGESVGNSILHKVYEYEVDYLNPTGSNVKESIVDGDACHSQLIANFDLKETTHARATTIFKLDDRQRRCTTLHAAYTSSGGNTWIHSQFFLKNVLASAWSTSSKMMSPFYLLIALQGDSNNTEANLYLTIDLSNAWLKLWEPIRPSDPRETITDVAIPANYYGETIGVVTVERGLWLHELNQGIWNHEKIISGSEYDSPAIFYPQLN